MTISRKSYDVNQKMLKMDVGARIRKKDVINTSKPHLTWCGLKLIGTYLMLRA